MTPREPDEGSVLLRQMALLQLKLLIDAARDLVLSPVTLGAALLDLLMLKKQAPRYFHDTLRMGKRSDAWIDLWSPVERRDRAPENVDALVQRVETLIRHPATGAQQVRVLKRWVEMQLARQRRRPDAVAPLHGVRQSPPGGTGETP